MKVCIDRTKNALLETLQNESVRKQLLTNGKSCDDSSITGGSSTASNDEDNDAFSKTENDRKMPAVTPPNHTKAPVVPPTPQKDPVTSQDSSDSESLL